MKHWARYSLVLVAALAIGGVSVVANASDNNASISQNYVGHRCVERSTTSSGYYYGVAIENDSATEAIVVYCPVDNYNNVALWKVADSNQVTHHTNSTHEWSAVVDDNTAGDVSCYLRVCERDESACDTGATDTTSGSGVETLTGSTDTYGSDNNPLMLRCSLPQRSGSNRAELRSYVVESF